MVEKWLKKIFSLQFLSFVVAIIGAYYGYKQFVRDEPGKVTLCTAKFTLEDKIRWILIGFDSEEDTIDIKNMRNLPLFGNMGKQPIEDVSIFGSIMEGNLRFQTNPAYNFSKGEDVGNKNPYVFSVRMEKIPYFSFFPFPIDRLKVSPREFVHLSVNMAYTYKGHPQLENFFFILTGIPKQYKNKSQEMYTKYIYPYLIKINKPESIAVIYKDTVITNLKTTEEINNKAFYDSLKRIKDFEK